MPEERREQVTRVVIEQSQRLTGGTRWSRWKAAASNGWHEPDKSRGLCPESVSGSGCKPPGRLGRRWSLIMRLVAWCFDRAPETPPAYSPVIEVLSGPKAHVRVADYTLIWISAAKCAQ